MLFFLLLDSWLLGHVWNEKYTKPNSNWWNENQNCHIFMFLLQSECFACIQIIKTVGDKNGIPVGMMMMTIKQSITLIPVIMKMVNTHVIYR